MDGEEINPRWQNISPSNSEGSTPSDEPIKKSKIRAVDLIIEVTGLNYCEGNAVKSIFLHNCTGDINDLAEARYYLDSLINAHCVVNPDYNQNPEPDTPDTPEVPGLLDDTLPEDDPGE